MTIYNSNREGQYDTTSWYKIWEAANAVYYKCVSRGYLGTFGGLGQYLRTRYTTRLTSTAGNMRQLFISISGS